MKHREVQERPQKNSSLEAEQNDRMRERRSSGTLPTKRQLWTTTQLAWALAIVAVFLAFSESLRKTESAPVLNAPRQDVSDQSR